MPRGPPPSGQTHRGGPGVEETRGEADGMPKRPRAATVAGANIDPERTRAASIERRIVTPGESTDEALD